MINLRHWIDENILTIVVFLPAMGAALLAFSPRRDRFSKWFALGLSIFTFIVSLHLPVHFRNGLHNFQFEIYAPWIGSPELNGQVSGLPTIMYHIGIDGISLWLVLLTTFLTPLALLCQWDSIHGPVKEFFILMLLLETAMLGVFVSLDLFLFYVFWEATLIPMALIIGIYGHERKVYAAVKFFLYTMVASVFMLAGIIWLYVRTGSFQFDVIQYQILHHSIPGIGTAAPWLFLAFFFAFAVKVPLFPFHTWLPDAHVEAPTAGSVILAGVLLKMGTYGLMRFNVGFFPEVARANAWWISALALIGIVYGALVALVQPNMKKLVAYSSVSHLGFVVLGIFSFNASATDGAVYQMLNHGISTGALFMLLGMIYDRRHNYEIKEYGGIATPMPHFATLFLIVTLSSIGLPLMNGFVGEFLILSGAFKANALWGMIAASGVIWSAFYMLWLYQRTFYGPNLSAKNSALPDITVRERIALVPLVGMALIMGLFSPYWMKSIDPSCRILNLTHSAVETIQAPIEEPESIQLSTPDDDPGKQTETASVAK
jgi:NADH-quinone oxidoreductase subunit M